jgi:hypothetical protein
MDNLPEDPIERDIETGHRLLHSLYDNGDLSVDQYDGIERALFCLCGLLAAERARADELKEELEETKEALEGWKESGTVQMVEEGIRQLRAADADLASCRAEAAGLLVELSALRASLSAAQGRERARNKTIGAIVRDYEEGNYPLPTAVYSALRAALAPTEGEETNARG